MSQIINKQGHDDADKGAKSEFKKRFKQQPLVFTGTIVILALTIITFVFWGAGDWILPNARTISGTELTFGYYGKTPIELTPGSFFAQMRENNIKFFETNYGWTGPQAEMEATQQAFKSAVVRAAMLVEVRAADYAPPKELVDKRVSQLEKYQENGAFSYLRYRAESQAQHTQTIKGVREDMLIARYQDDVAGTEPAFGNKFENAYRSPTKELDFFAAMASPQRSFSMAIFPYGKFPDSEVAAYIHQNTDLFKTTHLSQITITSSENDAKQVLAKIQSGETSFEDAAKNNSKDSFATSGGDAGERMAYELNTILPSDGDRAAVLALAAGSVSQIFKSGAGWVFFRAESAATPADSSAAATLAKVRSYLNESERGVIEDWLIKQAGSFAKDAASSTFEGAAKKYDVQAISFGPVAINYGGSPLFPALALPAPSAAPGAPEARPPQSRELDAAVRSENFWRTAFSTEIGTCSTPFVIDASLRNVVVIKPVSETQDSADSADAARKTFTDTFFNEDVQRSVQTTILASSKFRDNFVEHYYEVFPPEFSAPPAQ